MKSNFYISFGIWIAILPLLGIPGSWRNTLVFLSGIFLILVALGPAILKKLQPKQKRKQNKANNNELKFSETSSDLTHPPAPSLNLREGESETSSNPPLS